MMKQKAFALLGFLTVLVMALTMVSAVSLDAITETVLPTNVTNNNTQVDLYFNLTNTGVAGNLDFSSSTADLGGVPLLISFNDTSIAATATELIKATIYFSANQEGVIQGIVNVTGDGMSTYKNFSYSINLVNATNTTTNTTEDQIKADLCGSYFNDSMVSLKITDEEKFNIAGLLPSESNKGWFEDVQGEAIKNTYLINIHRPVGIDTVNATLKNPTRDFRGEPTITKKIVSPWLQSSIEPDNNIKIGALC